MHNQYKHKSNNHNLKEIQKQPVNTSRKVGVKKSKQIKMKKSNKSGANDNFQFANIVGGKFHIKVTKETEGAVMRENKKGEEVWEEICTEVEGVYLHSMEVVDTDYGRQLKVFLRDSENKEKFFVINAQLNSSYAYSILNRAEKVDLSKEVKVAIYSIDNVNEETKKPYKTNTITISQDGKLLDKNWDIENSPVPKAELILKNGKPVKKNGFDQYDSEARELFLETYVNDTLQEKFVNYLKDLHLKGQAMEVTPEKEVENFIGK